MGKPAKRDRTNEGAQIPRLQGWLIFLAAVLVFANTLGHGWVLDDSVLITQNKITKQGFAGIPAIWSSDMFTGFFDKSGIEEGGRYRPLTQTVFAITYAFWGDNPAPGHVINVLLHAFVCLLFFQLLFILFPTTDGTPQWLGIPFLTSLAYALHPLHVEVVANIKGLDEILAMLFSLLATLTMLRTRNGPLLPSLGLACSCFFLALSAKENAVTFLAVIPLVLYFAGVDGKGILRRTVPLLIPTLLYFILRNMALGAGSDVAPQDTFLTNQFHGASGPERIATVMLIWWKYLGLLVFPHPLTSDHYPAVVPIVGWTDLRAWAALLIFIGGGIIGLIGLRTRRPLSFGILYFLITFSVVSNLIVYVGTAMNDRFLFMPLAGFCILLAIAIRWISAQFEIRKVAWAGGVLTSIIFILYAGKTFSRNQDWKDDLTLFLQDVKISGNSARCNVMAGKVLYEEASRTPDPGLREERLIQARGYLERGLHIHERYPIAWGLLGIMEMDRGDLPKAAKYFTQSLEIDRQQRVPLVNLGLVAQRMYAAGDLTNAEQACRQLLLFTPGDTTIQLILADILRRTGRMNEAMAALDRLLEQQPGTSEAYRLKGDILANDVKDPVMAEQHFRKAVDLDPKNVTALENLAVLAFSRGDLVSATAYLERALEIQPNNAHLLKNLGLVHRAMGQEAKAQEYLVRALSGR